MLNLDNKMKKYAIASVLIFSLLCGAGWMHSVQADTSTGSVDVVEPKLTLSNLNVPSPQNPTEEYEVTVDMDDVEDITVMRYMYITVWHETVSETDPNDVATHYEATMWKGGISDQTPDFVINTTDIEGMTDETHITYSLNVSFQGAALSGSWTWKLVTEEEDGTQDEIQGTFQMNSYMSVDVVETTFDFQEVQQGMMQIPIADPTSGYLTADIVSNVNTKIQVKGTDPTDGSNTFAVENIIINDVDDPSTAVNLTGTLSDLNGATYNGENTAHIYLWITVPTSVPTGTYTFTLTVSIVAV